MADEPDEGLIRWVRERRDEAERVDHARTYLRLDPETNTPMRGWCGLEATSTDNERGEATFQIDARPVLDGRVELTVKISKRSAGVTRTQSKRAYLFPTPETVREFALALLQTADEAQRRRPRPRPVR